MPEVNSHGVEIAFGGTCTQSDPELIKIPPIFWSPPHGVGSYAKKVRDALNSNRKLNISTDKFGVIYVTDVDVSRTLLNDKLEDTALTGLERRSPSMAIDAMLESSAMQGEMKRSGTRRISTIVGFRYVSSERYLSKRFKSMTFDDFIRVVLRKFGGIVMYRHCPYGVNGSKFDVQYFN
jgi:hypothetical protein